MTSQDINHLVRERIQLQGTLRNIRRTVNDSYLTDTQKVIEIQKKINQIKAIIPD